MRVMRLVIAVLCVLLVPLVALSLPAVAVAAECTDTWTGPKEGGLWTTAGNWSTGKVPAETDVACIGATKEAKVSSGVNKVAVVQGEGTVRINETGTLEVLSTTQISTLANMFLVGSGTLTGPNAVHISNKLTLQGTSTMAGSGSITINSGATASVNGTTVHLTQRTFVNEGSTSWSTGTFEFGEGAHFNNVGTFEAFGATLKAGAGKSPLLENSGTIKGGRIAGTKIEVAVINSGTVNATAGVSTYLQLLAGGSSEGTGHWEGSKGNLVLGGGTFTLAEAVLAGEIHIEGASTTVTFEKASGTKARMVFSHEAHVALASGTLSIEWLFAQGASTVTGAGSLEVTEHMLFYESTMSGSGSLIVPKEATAELNSTHQLKERTFVNKGTTTSTFTFILTEGAQLKNEGTFEFNAGTMELSNGADILNSATFKANSTSEKGIAAGAGASKFVNTGTVIKATSGGTTTIKPSFENLGTIREEKTKLAIANPVTKDSSNKSEHECSAGDPVNCATGDFSERQTDIAIGGRGLGLSLTRTYSAQAAAKAGSPGAFGYGWSSSYSDHLASEEEGKKITLTQGDGGTVQFTEAGKGVYAPPIWSQDTLTGSSEAGYTLTTPDQTKYKFSASGRLESLTDRNGNETTLGYTEAGKLETITDPVGRKITLTYNGEGLVESAKDPMGHTVKYTYESKSLKTITLPGEASANWTFKYDASHRMTSMTDGRGGKTTNEYDASNRVTSQTDPAERKTTFEYASFHTKVTHKATGAVTDEWFTSNNEPFSITRGFGTASASTETFSYNEAGQLVSVTDGNGHTTTYGYDAAGNRTSEKDAAGENKWTYNSTHDVISMTTPRGETTTIKRDVNGNVESILRPGPEETTQTTIFSHDEQGQLESVVDPLEHTWSYGYDAQGDRASETDPLGDTQTLAYNKDSRLISIVTPRGNVEGAEPSEYEISIERDAQGRPLKVTDPLGHMTEYAYDANSNLKSKTDANGHTTKYTYNADNEQTKVEKPNGAALETGYDGAGEVTSETDANEHKTTYVRNVLEQPVEVIDPLGRKTIEEFDAAGNLKALIDPAERKTSYAYDAANRLVEVNYSEEATPDAKFEYDADGNVIGMVDGTGTSSFGYDQLGRLTRSEDGHGDVVAYGYNLGEELTGIAYPNGKSVSRTYDGAGRLESVTDWLGGTTSFSYDADANLEAIAFPVGTGNVDEYAYDHADRMSEAKFTKGAETLASLTYSREKLGQIEKEARNGLPGPSELSFAYDKNGRLTEAGAASFEYDPADNLTKGMGSTNTYDAASQLETGTGLAYTYDKLGERIKSTPSSGPATSYKYDQAGNLISVERPEEGEVPVINESFAYDGSRLMASKTSGLTTRYLTWDSSSTLPLLLSDGENSYLYGPNSLPIEQISSEEKSTYLHHDQLGSTRMLTNGSGESSATFSYAAYGGLEGRTGTATTPLGFAGQYTNAQTGLQYLRARFYDPATAQFLTHDPLAAITRAPYGYGAENPLNYVDPSGRACVETSSFGAVYPNLWDCLTESGEEIAKSPLTGPLVTLGCVFVEGCTPIRALIGGLLTATTSNLLRAESEPCFDFTHHEIESLLVLLAGAGPGGLLGRAGNDLGLSPTGERLLHLVTDAPGLALDLVHALAGG